MKYSLTEKAILAVIGAILLIILIAALSSGCGMEGDYAYTQQEIFEEVNTDRIPELTPECPPCPEKCKPSCIEKCWDKFQTCKAKCNTKCYDCEYCCNRAFKNCWEVCE